MAAPTAYTEETLKAYMHTVLGAVATALEWSVAGGQYDEPVNEVLLAYDVTDIANATNVRKLRALARREAWRAAVNSLASNYNFSADGARHDLSQVYEQAQKQLEAAEADTLAYDPDYAVTLGTMDTTYDPYEPVDVTEQYA